MIGSFSVCANDRAKREVALLIKSIRQFYDCPIFVFCDLPTKTFLESLGLDNLQFKLELEPKSLAKKERLVNHVKTQNDFHSKPIIFSKMDCIEWALWEVGDTFFVDADMVFLKPVDGDIDYSMELMLSPHFHVEDKLKQNQTYGVFNAGYLWTNKLDFPQAWRDVYLTNSNFYEQQGMIHLWEQYDIKSFDKNHNVGFWRFPKKWESGQLSLIEPKIEWQKVRSVHFHASPETYAHADPGLKKGYDLLKEIVVPQLPKNLREYINQI